ncbi:sugar ABC transporter permease [soil metagenome]
MTNRPPQHDFLSVKPSLLPGTPPGIVLSRTARYLATFSPAAILIAVFFIAPAIWAIAISMTPLTLLGATAGSTEFIGLDNYRNLFNDPDFLKYLRNTIVFTLGSAVVGATGGGLACALLIDHAQRIGNRLAAVAFAAIMFAGVCPPVLTGAIWAGLLDYRTGLFNSGMSRIGLEPVDWLGRFPLLSVIVAESWRNVALAMIVFTATLQMIPGDVYEAARIDGGSRSSVLRSITLPAIRPVAALVLLMTTILATGSFLVNEVLTSGGTSRQSETIALYAYHVAFTDFRIAFGAAISVVILALTAGFALVYLRVGRVRA